MTYRLSAKPLISEEEITRRLHEMGAEITRDYQGEPLVVIGVLKGSFIFLADLIRKISLPLEVEFIGVSSYAGTSSTGEVRITQDLSAEVEGKHVLLVEDIVDTGETVDYLLDVLNVRHPKSLKICTLLSKPESHSMRHKLDFVGFEIGKEFVVGYGLDVDGAYRQLPYIGTIETE